MIDNYADLPLGRYLDIEAVSRDDALEDIDRQVRIIAILSGRTERDLLAAPIAEYADLAAKTAFLARPCPAGRTARQYIAGDFTLIPTADLTKVTTAQYIDFQTFAPDADAHLVELLSVSLVPEGMTYNDGYDLADVQAAIREHLSVQDALALVADFFRRWLALTRATLNSLDKELKKADRIKDATKRAKLQAEIVLRKKQLRTLSTPVGDGLRKWTS